MPKKVKSKSLEIVQRFYPEVTSVKDATRGLKIEVTKGDTQTKAVKNHKECALAQACKRKLKARAIICVKTAYIIKGKHATRFLLPSSVSREITAFDREAAFEPGEYHLSAVSPSAMIGHAQRAPGSKRLKPKPINFHRTENIRHIGGAI